MVRDWESTSTFNLHVTGVSDAGGAVYGRFVGSRPGREGNSGIIDTGGSDTLSVSVWNTAPDWRNGQSLTTNLSGTIPENTSALTASWTAAGDSESGVYYTLWREYNNSGSWSVLSTSATSGFADSIGAGNQGQLIRYAVQARDTSGLISSTVYSNFITKNTFTAATLASSASIAFATTSIAFTASGASNTNANATFSYNLSCSSVTVYNPVVAAGTVTLTVYRTGTLPTGPYVKFDDIKTATLASGYKGIFNFTLTTANAYASTGTSVKSIAVDITTTPSTFASAVATSGVYTIGGLNYYIPNRKAIVAIYLGRIYRCSSDRRSN